MIIKDYYELLSNNELIKENAFYYYFTKAWMEIELNEISLAKESYLKVLELLEDNIEKLKGVIKSILYLAVRTNTFDELVSSTKMNTEYLNISDDNLVNGFLKYLDFVNLNYCSHEESIFQLIKKEERKEEKSVLCYMASLTIEDKKDSLDFCNIAVILWKYNLSASVNLIKNNEVIDVDILSNIIKADVNILNELKTTKECELNFEFLALGGGNEIGSSSYYLNIEGFKVIIDAGAKVTNSGEVYPNFDSLLESAEGNVKAEYKDIDCIFITHAHFDHCGSLKILTKLYPKVKIFMTKETKELIKINLGASKNNIHDYDVLDIINRAIVLEPKYPLNFRKKDVTVEFYNAGHILGAASILFKTKKGNVFFTGDYTIEQQLTLSGMDVPKEEIDILITENTYGDRQDLSPSKIFEYERLKYTVSKYIREGKHILIPTFSIGRSQEVLSIIKKLAKDENFRIYVDGLASKVNKLYEEYGKLKLSGDNVYYYDDLSCASREEFINEEFLTTRSVIIASSGMLLEGSVATLYAKSILPRNDGVVILTGYQAEDTLGAKILSQMNMNCERYITIDDECIKLLCKVENFNLSAHCSFYDILALTFRLKPKHLILTHGNTKEHKSRIQVLLENHTKVNVIQSINGHSLILSKSNLEL